MTYYDVLVMNVLITYKRVVGLNTTLCLLTEASN